ncbi:hypothetical protein RJ639_034382, partial [Escallonia herrerae]
MPLGERPGDKSDSRYCGVEPEFSHDMPLLLHLNINGGFDFVVATLIEKKKAKKNLRELEKGMRLKGDTETYRKPRSSKLERELERLSFQMDPTYRPSSIVSGSTGTGALPFAGSDLVLSPTQWSSHVVGKISSWIDLDSEDEMLRQDSEIALKQEIGWASHLSLQACLLPAPKGAACGNYARCVNQILQNLSNMQLWLRIPLEKSDDETTDENMAGGEVDSWELWNSFRHLCESHSQLSIALDVSCSLPSANSLGRWFGEPVRAAILHTSSFLTNARGYPCLSKRHQKLLTRFFDHSIQIVVSGKPADNHPMGTLELGAKSTDNHVESIQRHPLRSYLDYVGYLYQKMDPLPEQERFEPLMDNLEAQTYETFEKDTVKYIQYQRAISKALLDRIPDEQASTVTTVLMVVGAGRGPLVRASLQAAEETGRKLRVYAVEKNPNAVVTLHVTTSATCIELKLLSRLAAPAAAVYFLNYVMSMFTRIFSGHLGNLELAVASLGNNIQSFAFRRDWPAILPTPSEQNFVASGADLLRPSVTASAILPWIP